MVPLIGEIQRRETRNAEIDREVNRPAIDRAGLRRALEAKLDEWKQLLRSRPTHAQTVLRALLDGSIAIGDRGGDSVPWRAVGKPDGLLNVILSTKLASPTGCARVGAPETFIQGDIAA